MVVSVGCCKSLGFLYLKGYRGKPLCSGFISNMETGCALPKLNDQSVDHTVLGSASKITPSVSERVTYLQADGLHPHSVCALYPPHPFPREWAAPVSLLPLPLGAALGSSVAAAAVL